MKKTDIVFYVSFTLAHIVLAVLTIIFKWSWLSFFVCISSTYGTYLLAKKKPLGLIVCLISNLVYVYIAFTIKYYGDALFYLLIATPFTIASLITWNKNLDEERLVKPKKMPLLVRITSVLLGGLSIFLFGLVLKHFGGTYPFVDASSTVTSLFGFALMSLRYKEQWFFWVLQYIISTIMYILVKDVLIAVNCVFTLLLSILGDKIWEPVKENK